MRFSSFAQRIAISLLTVFFLAACSTSDDAPSSATNEINTLNFYLDDGTIYSFNTDTGISSERASFDESVGVLYLDTNADKQGYEFLAYTEDSTVYLLDYDKATKGRITNLGSFTGIICNISDRKTTSEQTFSEERRILISLPTLHISTNQSSCDASTNNHYEISFDFSEAAENQFSYAPINVALTNGTNIIDYNFAEGGNSVFSANSEKGRLGFLGYDTNGEQLVFYNTQYEIEWELSFSYADMVPSIRQVTNTEVLIQRDAEIFIFNISELFNAAEIVSDNSQQLPSGNRLETILTTPYMTLDNFDGVNPAQTMSNTGAFILEDGDNLLFYTSKNIKSIYTKDASLVRITYALTDNDTVILHKEYNNQGAVLSKIDTESEVESTLFQASRLSVTTDANKVYVNTLDSSSTPPWSAHLVETDTPNVSPSMYPNSIFVFTLDLQTMRPIPFILSNNEEPPTEDPLIMPSLYKFDASKTLGRAQTLEEGQRKDFSYGTLLDNTNQGANGIMVNEEYGMISFQEFGTTNPTNTYAFNPEEEDSLQLILRTFN